MRSIQCVICGKNQKIKELYKENFSQKKINSKTFSARRTPDRLHYRFVKCQNCGLIFSNPIMSTKEINKLYKNSTFDYTIESSYLKKTYGNYLIKMLKNKNLKKTKLLDVGCGNGFFLEEVKSMGINNIYGVEPGKSSVMSAPEWLRRKIKIGILKKGIYKKSMFDVICCFHTLDHIVKPNDFLENVWELLKKNGKTFFIVHDTNGLSVKLFGEKSPIFDIEHIYLFDKKNLKQLFKKNKFKNIRVFDIKNTYPLSYWLRMTPLPKIVKNYLLLLLKKYKLFDFSFSLKAGNIGIIAQK